MACPFCRFLAWVQHRLGLRAANKAAQAEKEAAELAAQAEKEAAELAAQAEMEAAQLAAQAENEAAEARDAARTDKIKRARSESVSMRKYEPPPTPLPPPGNTENLETLRARIPPRSGIVDEEYVFRPPEPTDTMEKACRAAAYAVEYPIYVATTEPERELVAARAVRAVATAVSTSPSYPVFVAAVTMAECLALISSENPWHSTHFMLTPPGIAARRRLNALNAAVEAGMAAYAENVAWPGDDDFNVSDSQDNSDYDSDSTPIRSSGGSVVRQRQISRLSSLPKS